MAGVAGLILAGGQGARMGGLDKGWVEWQGRPLIEWAIERLTPQVDSLMISANRHLDRYQTLGHAVFPDASQNFQGPLAGIVAGLAASPTPALLVVPCDCPRFPLHLIEPLTASAAGRGIAVAHDGERLQPLFLYLERRAEDRVTGYLAGGGRSVLGWLDSVDHGIADFSGQAGAFTNFNQLADLDARPHGILSRSG
ncbi:MAG: molybdenum cofactor guanylyltransferase MobA [Pseudomonadota bacterium]